MIADQTRVVADQNIMIELIEVADEGVMTAIGLLYIEQSIPETFYALHLGIQATQLVEFLA
jgi:hypothetical protein